MALMASSAAAPLSPAERGALDALVADLSSSFGTRLLSVVAYDLDRADGRGDIHTLALVEHLTIDDLRGLVPLARRWSRGQLAVPLILTRDELARTLDVFPLEYGSIIASHVAIFGGNPFAGLAVSETDWRRGCEQQAKSHLIHLREGFLESEGDARRIARLITASIAPFRALLANIVRLERGANLRGDLHDDDDLAEEASEIIGLPSPLVRDILSSRQGVSTVAEPSVLLARYIEASERLWQFVDRWKS
jgi:hypothetical protein